VRDLLCRALYGLTLAFAYPAKWLARLHSSPRVATSWLLSGTVLLLWYPPRGASLALWWAAQRVGRRYS